jgi:hypothetical protein
MSIVRLFIWEIWTNLGRWISEIKGSYGAGGLDDV